MVMRNTRPTAIANCSHSVRAEVVNSSGVRIIPPCAQIATKKPPVPARIKVSVLPRSSEKTSSTESNRLTPTAVRSRMQNVQSRTRVRTSNSMNVGFNTPVSPIGA